MPTVAGNDRILPEDTYLGGYLMPKGTMVVVAAYAMYHDEALFPDAHEFIPERWTGKEDDDRFGAYVPFSAGSRSCIGMSTFMRFHLPALMPCHLRSQLCNE